MSYPATSSSSFESTTNFQIQITKANDAYIDLLLTAARFRAVDPLATFFLGVTDETLSTFARMQKSNFVNAAQVGAPVALPRFSAAATIRAMLTSGFQSSVVHHAFCESMPLTPGAHNRFGRQSSTETSLRFEASPALQESTRKANDAYIDLLLMAAQSNATDPLAAFLLGVSHDTLTEYAKVNKADLVSASKLGAPLFVPRFTNPAMLMALLTSGFKSPEVQQELTKTFSLSAVPQRRAA